jgi:hypothetical protein
LFNTCEGDTLRHKMKKQFLKMTNKKILPHPLAHVHSAVWSRWTAETRPRGRLALLLVGGLVVKLTTNYSPSTDLLLQPSAMPSTPSTTSCRDRRVKHGRPPRHHASTRTLLEKRESSQAGLKSRARAPLFSA